MEVVCSHACIASLRQNYVGAMQCMKKDARWGPSALENVGLETVMHFNGNGHVAVTCGAPMKCPHTALIL